MSPEIFHEPIEVYLARNAVRGPQVPTIFAKMQAEANNRAFPIVGPEAGRLFYQLAALKRPRRVLELGSGFGYSAIWWALGCEDTEVILTEYKKSNIDQARRYAQEAGVAERLHFLEGAALETAQQIQPPVDIIFADIDKEDYPKVVDFALAVLEPGGLLLFDNMLWHGEVVLPEDEQTPNTAAVIETTRLLYEDDRWMTSLLPVRDGILIALRQK